jgi:hypothetical protein
MCFTSAITSFPLSRSVLLAEQWVSYLALWLQNEGVAVYVPWALRQSEGHLDDPDYRLLQDPEALRRLILRFGTTPVGVTEPT